LDCYIATILEMGIDYRADLDYGAQDKPDSPTAFLGPWFSPPVVYACGPGIYLRPVGRSQLVPVAQDGEVTWYKLQNSIKLDDLPLDYCDKPKEAATREKTKTDNAESEEGEDWQRTRHQKKGMPYSMLVLNMV
jgi:hypothetical protein